jgi:hypothetical protein
MPSSAFPRSSGKTHIGAPVVEGEDAPALVDDEDGTMATLQDEPSSRLQLLEAPGQHQFLFSGVHEQPLPHFSHWVANLIGHHCAALHPLPAKAAQGPFHPIFVSTRRRSRAMNTD